MNWQRAYYTLSFTLLFFGMMAAQTNDPTGQLKSALRDLCIGLRSLVPIAAMLMILLAAVIYATGQMMGAETRARANVWATSCLTGALIGIIIASVAPAVLDIMAPNGTHIDCE